MYPAHASWDEHWHFIKHHFLPRLDWARLKLSFGKLKLGMDKIMALGELHQAGGQVSPKPERISKLLDWPTPQTATDVRAFLGTALTVRQWIRNYAELARPLSRLTGSKTEWRWEEAESLAFMLIKNKAANAAVMFGWDPSKPVEMYTDASAFAAGCFVRQKQQGNWVPITYDSFTFSKTERNYDTYKRELKALVAFATKYSHMLSGSITSTIWTDHKPLTGFLNSETHQDIFFRFREQLRPLNIKICHIKGSRNSAADGLSRAIFPGDCQTTEAIKNIHEKVEAYDRTGTIGSLHEAELSALTAAAQEGDSHNNEQPLELTPTVGWTTFGLPDDSDEDVHVNAVLRPKKRKRVTFAEAEDIFSESEQEPSESSLSEAQSFTSGLSEAESMESILSEAQSSEPRLREVESSQPSQSEVVSSKPIGNRGPSNKGLICSNENCQNPAHVRGLCNACYQRKRKLEKDREKNPELNPDSWKIGPPPLTTNKGQICRNELCQGPAHSKGLCVQCYVRKKYLDGLRKEDPSLDEDRWKTALPHGKAKYEGKGCRNSFCGREPSQVSQHKGLCAICFQNKEQHKKQIAADPTLDPTAWMTSTKNGCANELCSRSPEEILSVRRGLPFKDDLCLQCYRHRQKQIGLTDAEGRQYQGLGDPSCITDEGLHVKCKRTPNVRCEHLCCLSHLISEEMADAERKKFFNLPTKGVAYTDRPADCERWHKACSKDSCQHWCCRVLHYKCREKHNYCDRITCDHPCCKIWTAYVLLRVMAEQGVQKPNRPMGDELNKLLEEFGFLNEEISQIATAKKVDTPSLRSRVLAWGSLVQRISGTRVNIPKAVNVRDFEHLNPEQRVLAEATQRSDNDDSEHEDAAEHAITGAASLLENSMPHPDPGQFSASTLPFYRPVEEEHDQDIISMLDDYHSRMSVQKPFSDFSFLHSNSILIDPVPVNRIETEVDWDALREEWYGDITRYLKHQEIPQNWTPQKRGSFKRLAERYGYDKKRAKLVHSIGGSYVDCADPRDVAKLLRRVHDNSGHFSIEIVNKKLKERVFWPTMTKDIKEYIASCPKCMLWNQRRREEPLKTLDCVFPWEMVQADLIGPLPQSTDGYSYILCATCCLSGYAVVRPLKSKQFDDCTKELLQIFDTLHDPIVLYTDQGREFSATSSAPMKERNILLVHAAGHSHRTTGAVENMNRIVRRCMEKSLPLYRGPDGHFYNDLSQWPEAVAECVRACNERYITNLGFTPMEVMFGHLPDQLKDMERVYKDNHYEEVRQLAASFQPNEIPEGDLQQACFDIVTNRANLREDARMTKEHGRRIREGRFNRTLHDRGIMPGDLVLISGAPATQKSVISAWSGPFRVGAPVGEHGKTFQIQNPDTGAVRREERHVSQMRRIVTRPMRLCSGGEPAWIHATPEAGRDQA